MKRLPLLVGLTLFLSPLGLSEAVVDRVVAVVNQEIITLSEVEKLTMPLKEQITTEDRLQRRERLTELHRQVLNRLIEEKLIDQEVKKSGIKISSKEIEATMDEVKRRNSASQEDLEKALSMEGMTLDTYKKQIEKTLLRQKLINYSVKVEPKGGEKELREFYEKNVGRYRTNETYRPSHILLIVPKGAAPEEVREIRKKGEKVLEKIKGGADFGEMALLYSQDASAKNRGELGYFKRGDLLPAFERAALNLKVGEVSGLIRTDFGFHIIKILDRKGLEPLAFEEVRNKVRQDCYEIEMDKAIKQFISTLKEKAVIEIKL